MVIYDDETPLPPLFTDMEGRFASGPLPESRYHLSVTKAGYALTRVAGTGVVSVDGVDIRMPRSSGVTGRALDSFGEPAAGLAVSISVAPPAGVATAPPPIKTASTDDLGEYRLGGLSAGTYLVAVNSLSMESSGAVIRTPAYFPGVPAAADAQRITLQPGDQKGGVDFSGVAAQAGGFATAAQLIQDPAARIVGPAPAQLLSVGKGTGMIRGRITRTDGLAVAHATVTALAPQATGNGGPARPQSTTTDEDGRYEFVELPKGDYRIQAAKAGFTGGAYGQKTAADRSGNVALADNQTRTRIDITLSPYSAIAGQVFDDFGDPVEDVTVSISRIRFIAGRRRLVGVNGVVSNTTDDLGHYRVFGLPPGQYVVTASVGQVTALMTGADVSGFAPTYFPGTANAGDARLVAVQQAQDALGVDVALGPVAARMGARIQVVEVPPGPPVLQTLVAEVYGPDTARRIDLARQVRATLEHTKGVVDVDWYVDADHSAWRLDVDSEKAAAAGVSAADVAAVVRMAGAGAPNAPGAARVFRAQIFLTQIRKARGNPAAGK